MTTSFLTQQLMPLMLCLSSFTCAADQLVYTPVNPTFGGNPNNASGLLAIANAQNDYKAPVVAANTSTPLTALEKFNQNLQSQMLTRLQSKLLGDLFTPAGDLTVGSTILAGNYEIKVTLADQATCNCPVGSQLLTTRDVTIPGSSTSIVIGSVQ